MNLNESHEIAHTATRYYNHFVLSSIMISTNQLLAKGQGKISWKLKLLKAKPEKKHRLCFMKNNDEINNFIIYCKMKPFKCV